MATLPSSEACEPWDQPPRGWRLALGITVEIAPGQQRSDDCNARRAAGSLQPRLGRPRLAHRVQAANIFLRRWLPVHEPSHQVHLIRRSSSAGCALGYLQIVCFARWAVACFSSAFFVRVSLLPNSIRLQLQRFTCQSGATSWNLVKSIGEATRLCSGSSTKETHASLLLLQKSLGQLL